MEKSLVFYRDKLGFEVTFEWDKPINYAVIKAGDAVSIHLMKANKDYRRNSEHTALYIFVHNVDAIYELYKIKDVRIVNEIGNRDYGMRDFDIEDPDGHLDCIW